MKKANSPPSSPRVDILPVGHRSVQHELVLEGPIASGIQLVAYPTRGFHVPHRIVAGEPFTFSSKYGTRIYALPHDATVPEKVQAEWFDPFPSTGTFLEISSVPVGNPLARVLTTLRVSAIHDETVEVETVAVHRMDSDGGSLSPDGIVPVLVGISVLGLIGLIVLARRRKRSNLSGEPS